MPCHLSHRMWIYQLSTATAFPSLDSEANKNPERKGDWEIASSVSGFSSEPFYSSLHMSNGSHPTTLPLPKPTSKLLPLVSLKDRLADVLRSRLYRFSHRAGSTAVVQKAYTSMISSVIPGAVPGTALSLWRCSAFVCFEVHLDMAAFDLSLLHMRSLKLVGFCPVVLAWNKTHQEVLTFSILVSCMLIIIIHTRSVSIRTHSSTKNASCHPYSSQFTTRQKHPSFNPNINLENALFTSSPKRPSIGTHCQACGPDAYFSPAVSSHLRSSEECIIAFRESRESSGFGHSNTIGAT